MNRYESFKTKEFNAARELYIKNQKVYSYFAYSKGKVVGEFKTETEAKNAGLVVEKVCVNQEQYEKIVEQYNVEQQLVIDRWYTALREEHKEVNEKTFQLMYNFAYEKSHSGGYDEVADTMDSLYDFVNGVIEAQK